MIRFFLCLLSICFFAGLAKATEGIQPQEIVSKQIERVVLTMAKAHGGLVFWNLPQAQLVIENLQIKAKCSEDFGSNGCEQMSFATKDGYTCEIDFSAGVDLASSLQRYASEVNYFVGQRGVVCSRAGQRFIMSSGGKVTSYL